jgi:hypothetical protein
MLLVLSVANLRCCCKMSDSVATAAAAVDRELLLLEMGLAVVEVEQRATGELIKAECFVTLKCLPRVQGCGAR